MKTDVVIVKVLQRKDNVKMAIIPKKSNIEKGQYVLISNDLNVINKYKEEKNARKRN